MTKKWDLIPISQIARKVSRPESVDGSKVYRLLGAHWYAKGLYVKGEKLGTEIRASKLFAVKPGDFVYNRLFAWKGSFAVAREEHEGCFVSNEFPCFELDRKRVSPKFLWFYFSRESAWLEALGLSSGSTPTSRNRLKEEQFLQMQIPLPSLEEQRRIVARIEELAALIEEAQGLRAQAREEAEALRLSALNEVFSRLSTENVERWPLSDTELCHLVPGQHIMSKDYNTNGEGTPYITGPADFGAKSPEISKWTTNPKSFSEPGDVLVTVKGAGVGKINCAPDFPLCIGRQVMALRPKGERLIRDYLYYFLMNNYDYFQDVARSTTVPGLKREHIWDMEILLPPVAEQRRIVAYLDDLQAQVDELIALQEATQAELDALLPSVLDRAFRGEL